MENPEYALIFSMVFVGTLDVVISLFNLTIDIEQFENQFPDLIFGCIAASLLLLSLHA